MVEVSLNGEWVEVKQDRLADAMQVWNYRSGKCAVAVNGEFVPRSSYQQVVLKNGDKVDVVAPVGGG